MHHAHAYTHGQSHKSVHSSDREPLAVMSSQRRFNAELLSIGARYEHLVDVRLSVVQLTSSYMNLRVRADFPTPPVPTMMTL